MMFLTSALQAIQNTLRKPQATDSDPPIESANEQVNARCNTHTLPVEVLLEIDRNLQGADSLSFRYCCRWCAASLRRPLESFSPTDRRIFRLRFGWDTYPKLAAAEKRKGTAVTWLKLYRDGDVTITRTNGCYKIQHTLIEKSHYGGDGLYWNMLPGYLRDSYSQICPHKRRCYTKRHA
jgi:hypothetical protein